MALLSTLQCINSDISQDNWNKLLVQLDNDIANIQDISKDVIVASSMYDINLIQKSLKDHITINLHDQSLLFSLDIITSFLVPNKQYIQEIYDKVSSKYDEQCTANKYQHLLSTEAIIIINKNTLRYVSIPRFVHNLTPKTRLSWYEPDSNINTIKTIFDKIANKYTTDCFVHVNHFPYKVDYFGVDEIGYLCKDGIIANGILCHQKEDRICIRWEDGANYEFGERYTWLRVPNDRLCCISKLSTYKQRQIMDGSGKQKQIRLRVSKPDGSFNRNIQTINARYTYPESYVGPEWTEWSPQQRGKHNRRISDTSRYDAIETSVYFKNDYNTLKVQREILLDDYRRKCSLYLLGWENVYGFNEKLSFLSFVRTHLTKVTSELFFKFSDKDDIVRPEQIGEFIRFVYTLYHAKLRKDYYDEDDMFLRLTPGQIRFRMEHFIVWVIRMAFCGLMTKKSFIDDLNKWIFKYITCQGDHDWCDVVSVHQNSNFLDEILKDELLHARSVGLVSRTWYDHNFYGFVKKILNSKLNERIWNKADENKYDEIDENGFKKLMLIVVILFKVAQYQRENKTKMKPKLNKHELKLECKHLCAWIIRKYGLKTSDGCYIFFMIKKNYKDNILGYIKEYTDCQGSVDFPCRNDCVICNNYITR